jgi:protein tyrosine phosphatase (PTP) superfamily phosphohydrolase (DUF442 family)
MSQFTSIYNFLKITDSIYTSGQPTEEQLRAAAEEGVQVVINLATLESESTLEDEAGVVQKLGMKYVHIPIVWDNPKAEDFDEFVRVMHETTGKKHLIHCVANYRVTAFYSLYAMKILGWSVKQADALMEKIWDEGEYPVWRAFVSRIRERG